MKVSQDRSTWGGSVDQYCQECECQKHYIPKRDCEIWIFDWCYHEDPVSEDVRLLASLFFLMIAETRPPAKA